MEICVNLHVLGSNENKYRWKSIRNTSANEHHFISTILTPTLDTICGTENKTIKFLDSKNKIFELTCQ